MSRLDNIFVKQSSKRKAEQKALEILKNKKNKKIPVSTTAPKDMRGKVEYAKNLSLQVFGKKLDQIELVTDVDRIQEYLENTLKNGILAVDTETNGLDRITGEIAGVCLYTPNEKGIYIPLHHYSFMTNQPLKTNVAVEVMREFFIKCNEKKVKYIFHNAKFDMHILYWMVGVEVEPYWDTQIGSQLLNENEPHGLKALYQKYCVGANEEQQTASFNSLFKGTVFTKIPPDVGYMYASFDPIMTYELYQFQYEFLDIEGTHCKSKGLERVAKVFREIEMPLIKVVFDMECTGVQIDTDLASKLQSTYKVYMEQAEVAFKNEVKKLSNKIEKLQVSNPVKYSKLVKNGKIDINIGSTQQLAILFYDVLHFESPDKKSPRGTGEDILKHYDHPIVQAILEYRSMSKLLSTYVEAIPGYINKRTGKLHASFNQYGAKTGRFSSNDPNLQNIPSKAIKLSDGTKIDAGHDIRQMFIAGEGQVIVGGDFSQQEPRCLAHMSGDEHMINAYLEGKDLYGTIASKIYKMPYEECLEFRPDGSVNPEGKARRTSVKPVLLGIMYGRGVPSIAEQMKITPKEAQGIIDDFYNGFPKVKDFVDFAQQFAHDYGFVETAWGRKRRLTNMLLDPIEIKKCIKDYDEDFDVFAFNADEVISQDDYVSDEVYYKYVRLMKQAYGRAKKQEVIDLALKEGYAITDNSAKIAEAQRQCVNSIIQGSAADMTKITMIKIHDDEELNKLGYKLIIPVHDEVLGVCPKENAKAVRDRLEHIMVHIVDGFFKIPMKCDIEVTERWYGEGIEI